jgi:hypothetical protein
MLGATAKGRPRRIRGRMPVILAPTNFAARLDPAATANTPGRTEAPVP